MTLFQLILLGTAAYFAWHIYKFVQGLQEGKPNLPSDDGESLRNRQSAPPPPAADRPDRSAAVSALAQSTPELIAKADAAYHEGDLADARVYLERAEKADPDNPEILDKLGFVLHRLGEEEAALRCYERALRIDPNDDLTHNAVAAVLRALGRLDEAQEHYKAAAEIDDTFELTYYNYGQLLLEKGDTQGARMMFEKALELKPDYEEAKRALAELEERESGESR